MTHIQTVTVTYAPSKPTNATFAPKTVTRLHKGDTTTIELYKFQANATIEKIDFYNNKVNKKGENCKDMTSPLGSWTSRNGNSKKLKGVFICAEDSSKQVILIVDTEDNEDDSRYWYSASGKTGVKNKKWSIDPEVINKGR